MLTKRTFRMRFILVPACILALAALSACQPAGTTTGGPETDPATSGTTAASASSTPQISNRPDAASGTLRIWWSRRQTLNPLLDTTRTGHAVNRLVYQSLFTIDENQQYIPDLAAGIQFRLSGTQVVVTIKKNLFFHDGTPLTAEDAAECIKFIQAHPTETAYSADLAGIINAVAINDEKLILTLTQPDPWLPFVLTFPVIPSEYLETDPFTLIPGSGAFVMESFSAEDGLVLKKAAAPEYLNELTTIRVIEYNNLTAAMQGFENDNVDLVYMDASDYSRYQLRDSLRFEPFTSGKLLMIAFNTASRKPLSNLDRLLFLKKILQPSRVLAASRYPWGGEVTDIPIPAASWLLGGEETSSSGVLVSLGNPTWDSKTRALVLLVPQEDALYGTISEAIGRCLDVAGVKWQMKSLPKAEYDAEMLLGNFDMALLETGSHASPDPSWLYRDNRPAAETVLNILPNIGLDGYGDWRLKLTGLMSAERTEDIKTGRETADALAQTAARSPFGILLLRSGALLYGNRIVGQGRPSADDPYQGIKELWVWSG
jgi:ABC-type transport system substrate-binding protein